MKFIDVPQSGSFAAETHSRNRFGQYVRKRSLPVQPRTALQLARRATVTAVSAAWRGLTAAQQAAWISFAASFTVVNSIGTTINLTGLQAFVKVNAVNQLLGTAIASTPPALPTFTALNITGLTCSFSGQTVKLAGTAPAAGTDYLFYASGQKSAGVNFNAEFRFIEKNDVPSAGSFDITTAYLAKFGALISGKKIFVKVVQNQSGMQDSGTLFAALVS